MSQSKIKPALRSLSTIFVISLISVIIRGYQFAVTDQAIFIPYILKAQDNSLFPTDQLFSQSSAFTSLYYYLMAFLLKFVDIQILFFSLFLIFNFLFFACIYNLAKLFLNDERLSYLSLMPFVVPKFISGIGIYTIDSYFGYKSIGVVFFLLFLTFLIKDKFLKASTAASFGFLFHPLSIIPTFLNQPVLILINKKTTREKIFLITKSILIFVFLITPFILVLDSKLLTNANSLRFFDKAWLEIIRSRDDYLFLSRWTKIEWFALIFYFLIVCIFYGRMTKKIKKVIKVFSIISLLILLFNFIFLEIIKTPLIAQYQLNRSIVPIAYIALIISPLLVTYRGIYLKALGAVVFISLCTNQYPILTISTIIFALVLFIRTSQTERKISNNLLISVLAIICMILLVTNYKSFSNVRQKYQIPKPVNYWMDVQKWALTNTNKSDTFVVLPRQIGFRIFSKRQIIPDVKDGAVVMYDAAYAKKWQQTSDDFANFYSLTESEFLKLKEKYNFQYIVTINTHNLNFEKAYKNGYYTVYKL